RDATPKFLRSSDDDAKALDDAAAINTIDSAAAEFRQWKYKQCRSSATNIVENKTSMSRIVCQIKTSTSMSRIAASGTKLIIIENVACVDSAM
ncbi:10576_t:CDS:1, partial [Paraglomus brasilianum]